MNYRTQKPLFGPRVNTFWKIHWMTREVRSKSLLKSCRKTGARFEHPLPRILNAEKLWQWSVTTSDIIYNSGSGDDLGYDYLYGQATEAQSSRYHSSKEIHTGVDTYRTMLVQRTKISLQLRRKNCCFFPSPLPMKPRARLNLIPNLLSPQKTLK